MYKESPTASQIANDIVHFLNEKHDDQDWIDGYSVLKALAIVSRQILGTGNNSQISMLLTPYEVSLEWLRTDNVDSDKTSKANKEP